MDSPLYPSKRLTKVDQKRQVESYPDLLKAM